MQTAILVLLAIGTAMGLPSIHIVGGIEAKKGEFPHIVQLQKYGRHSCGGSIVNANWIVTAAHCAQSPINSYTIVAGEHNLLQNEGTEQSRPVSEIIVHPNYNSLTLENDIALMKVRTPFRLNKDIQVAELAGSNFSPASQVTAAGWGTLS